MPIRLTQNDVLGYDPVHVRLAPDTVRVQKLLPDEAVCASDLDPIWWPEGFRCPFSEQVGEPYRIQAKSRVLECRQCLRQIIPQ